MEKLFFLFLAFANVLGNQYHCTMDIIFVESCFIYDLKSSKCGLKFDQCPIMEIQSNTMCQIIDCKEIKNKTASSNPNSIVDDEEKKIQKDISEDLDKFLMSQNVTMESVIIENVSKINETKTNSNPNKLNDLISKTSLLEKSLDKKINKIIDEILPTNNYFQNKTIETVSNNFNSNNSFTILQSTLNSNNFKESNNTLINGNKHFQNDTRRKLKNENQEIIILKSLEKKRLYDEMIGSRSAKRTTTEDPNFPLFVTMPYWSKINFNLTKNNSNITTVKSVINFNKTLDSKLNFNNFSKDTFVPIITNPSNNSIPFKNDTIIPSLDTVFIKNITNPNVKDQQNILRISLLSSLIPFTIILTLTFSIYHIIKWWRGRSLNVSPSEMEMQIRERENFTL